MSNNKDPRVIRSFGYEWSVYDQQGLPKAEQRRMFERYFARFPWDDLPDDAEGFDLGCGSGRWAQLAAERVGHLHAIDPSDALEVARRNLAGADNVTLHSAGVEDLPISPASMDFGFSLGVLHHIPDTEAGLRAAVSCLKPGAPFLLYLYYAFDNKPAWYRAIWRASELGRALIHRLPAAPGRWLTEIIAVLVYWPLARLSLLLETVGLKVDDLPLADYRHNSLYVMRTDAFDRFHTPLERRFTRVEIHDMLSRAGLERIVFNELPPYWCAVGRKAAAT